MASNITPKKCSEPPRSKSCETACSSNSSCFFQRRKPMNPLASSIRSGLSKPTSSVRQRVLSAKLLKLKSVQNQLNDANFHLAEVMRENQALKTLQKRQDKALSKYEGTSAELPRLIQSHEEEIRVLTEKNKCLRKNAKELNEQLKHKNDELLTLQEQIRHYEKLDKDKHLLEREKLIEELEDAKEKLRKADSEIVLLNRKLTLENKTSKQKLNMEVNKHKQCQKELAQALSEINKMTKLLETTNKTQASTNGRKRFSNLNQKASSLISLNGTKSVNSEENCERINPVTEIKLQPLSQLKDEFNNKPKSILKCPSESIRARLSAESKKEEDEEKPERETHQSRPNSCHKLEKIEMNLHNTLKKIEDNKTGDAVSKHLGNFCLEAIDSVKDCTEMIENHKENLAHAKEDTDKILQRVKSVESIEKRLMKEAKLIGVDGNSQDEDFDFISKILKDEAEFQAKYPAPKINGKKEPIPQNDKKKLLATLRAIDNGDSVESFGSEENKSKSELSDISN